MKFLRKRKTVVTVTYHLHFESKIRPGCGFGFQCDEKGNVYLDSLTDLGRKNYEELLNGELGRQHHAPEVQTYRNTYVEPAVIRCDCGDEVELHGFTNTCDTCDADYNHGGQRLAPRCQWGEETGESVSDILAADSDAGMFE